MDFCNRTFKDDMERMYQEIRNEYESLENVTDPRQMAMVTGEKLCCPVLFLDGTCACYKSSIANMVSNACKSLYATSKLQHNNTIHRMDTYGPALFSAVTSGYFDVMINSTEASFYDRIYSNAIEWSLFWRIFPEFLRQFKLLSYFRRMVQMQALRYTTEQIAVVGRQAENYFYTKIQNTPAYEYFKKYVVEGMYMGLRYNNFFAYHFNMMRHNLVILVDDNVQRVCMSLRKRGTGSDFIRSFFPSYVEFQNIQYKILYRDIGKYLVNLEDCRQSGGTTETDIFTYITDAVLNKRRDLDRLYDKSNKNVKEVGDFGGYITDSINYKFNAPPSTTIDFCLKNIIEFIKRQVESMMTKMDTLISINYNCVLMGRKPLYSITQFVNQNPIILPLNFEPGLLEFSKQAYTLFGTDSKYRYMGPEHETEVSFSAFIANILIIRKSHE